jgi:asparagine synthase (glutamine-hydrolysing)
MCGICGFIYKDTKKVVDQDLLRKMSDTLRHRGPDDEGMHIDKNVGLAHKRLSIIDLSGGHQPIFNEDKSISIVFNGEIYNHENLRKELIEKGHFYHTKSDTETILHAYEEYGENCLSHLRGMFAFAIHDSRKRRVLLARDRVGKKPLYYYHDDQVFIFASEIKAILKSGMVRNEVNKRMLDFYISLGYVPGKETLFKDIHKLEPGQYLVLEGYSNVRLCEYWDINAITENDIPYEDSKHLLKEKLLESVRIRLMSEVPLGVFLSGGLDSSTIVALMSQVVSQPIKTFSVGYKDEPEMSELKYARQVSDIFKTEHHEFYLTPDDLFDSIETLLEHAEEPIVESAGIALYKLAKLAKPEATVLLSGEGADEILAGYPIYSKMNSIEIMHRLYNILPKQLFDAIVSRFKSREKIAKYGDWIREPFIKRYKSMSLDVSESMKDPMYTTNFRESADGAFESYFMNLHNKVTDKTLLRRMLYIDTKSWLAEDILLKADRMTMAASVELRAPFLDHELIEFATSLPDAYKLRHGTGKYILRDIMKDILPNEILHRTKKGFPVPLTSWFSGKLYERAKALLTEKKSLDRGYFKPEYIYGLFDGISKGEDLGKRIFSLVTLELWHRKYID